MPTNYRDSRVQGTGAASAYVTLYSTGESTSAIISNFMIANEAATSVTVRLGISASATTPTTGNFLLYDVVVSANDTLSFGPYSLSNNRFVRVSSTSSSCTFSAAVAEIS